VDSSGRIYVAGQAVGRNKGRYTDQWVVRRSTNGGASWSVVDNLTLGNISQPNFPQTGPTGITISPSGAIIVCGYAPAASGTLRWIVRQGTLNPKGSVSWTEIDNYQMQGQSSRANAVVTDAYGRIYVAGRGADQSGSEHWLIRGTP
jgi:hypothetical protein